MNRRPVVAGNWKMYHGPRATEAFFEAFELPPGPDGPRVVIFPPAVSLSAAVASPSRDPRIEVGIQNVYWEAEGAFTGEISVGMAREAGAGLALVGHSERRHVFGESDDEVGRKVRAASEGGLVPVVCVGETLDERRAGQVEEVILRQLAAALSTLPPEVEWLLAYEPVWAIGTGETATPADAASAHRVLREGVRARGLAADEVPILYGGSVKPANVRDLMSAPDVDGVLVGGASLDPESFARIVSAAGSGTV